MAATSTPRNETREVRIEDYAPPPFLVDSIDLDLDLADDECLVTATLEVRRAPGTPADTALVLDGTALELMSVELDGGTLGRTSTDSRMTASSSPHRASPGPGTRTPGAPARKPALRTRSA